MHLEEAESEGSFTQRAWKDFLCLELCQCDFELGEEVLDLLKGHAVPIHRESYWAHQHQDLLSGLSIDPCWNSFQHLWDLWHSMLFVSLQGPRITEAMALHLHGYIAHHGYGTCFHARFPCHRYALPHNWRKSRNAFRVPLMSLYFFPGTTSAWAHGILPWDIPGHFFLPLQ